MTKTVIKTSKINVRIDPRTKAQAEKLFSDMGLDISTAVNIFIRQSINCGGIPFEVRSKMPNKETIEAMKEAEEILQEKSGRFKTAEDMFDSLGI